MNETPNSSGDVGERLAGAEVVTPQGDIPTESVTAPAKVMRIGSMIKRLLDEVHSMNLDAPSKIGRAHV